MKKGPDYAHHWTNGQLAALEFRIAAVYREAADDLGKTVTDYFDKFAKRDAEQKARLEAGEITQEYYTQWRLNQMGRGERFEAMRDKVAQRMTEANKVAVAYTNDVTPGIYSLNRNYTAYTIEQVSPNADFTLWDEQTVKRMIVEQPEVMPKYLPPPKRLAEGIDFEYGKKQVTKSVTSSILTGRSIKGIADDLQQRITTMDRNSAIRTARTAVTAAQNAGRMDSYAAAEKMGIGIKKRWLATLDNRTRHAHQELDGHKPVPYDEPFTVDGYEIMYPGDPSAEAYLVYNCRCTLIAEVDGVDTSDAKRRARDPETGESVLIENMSYQEWAGWKKKVGKSPEYAVKEKIGAATTVSEISEAISKFAKANVDLTGMDIELAKRNMWQIINLSEEYGVHFSEIKVTSARKYLGDVERVGRYGEKVSLLFPKKYYKSESALLEELKKSSNSGNMPAGIGRRNISIYTTTHEFAHTLSEEFTTRLYGYGKETDFWDEIDKLYTSAKKDGDTSLGKYALSNPNEFMAEAFAAAKLCISPSKTALDVLEVIEKYFKKRK